MPPALCKSLGLTGSKDAARRRPPLCQLELAELENPRRVGSGGGAVVVTSNHEATNEVGGRNVAEISCFDAGL